MLNFILQPKKKNKEENIGSRLALAVKTGKYCLGLNQTLKTVRSGKAELIIVAKNANPLVKSKIEYYSMLARKGIHHFDGNNTDLGTACGKLFKVSFLAITDPGDSDILKIETSS